jgi:IclR family transcriptional regulator, pca regulon regulatory protein
VPAPRKHDDATMARAVGMYHERVRGLGESKLAARRHVGALLGINPATLRKWVEREDARTDGDTDGGSGRQVAEIDTLRREVAELRRANDALRRAAARQAHGPPALPTLPSRASAATPRSEAGPPPGLEFVQSLERGLAVIRAFDARNPELTLSDVARSTGLSRAVARRFLHTLVALGYVHTDGRRFALRARVLELGYSYVSSLGLPQIAQPHLEALAARVKEACSVTVLDGDDVVYVARVPSPRMVNIAITVGTRFPAYATSTGRVLLADQPEHWLAEYLERVELVSLTKQTIRDPRVLQDVLLTVRSVGYSKVDQEMEDGIQSLAVPLHDGGGATIAALNISAPAHRRTPEAMVAEHLAPLRETAGRIEEDLRGGR